MWIDVTDLIPWRGRKTSAQRVIHDMIAAYSTIREVSLFYYGQRLSMFFDVPVSEYFQQAVRVEEGQSSAGSPAY